MREHELAILWIALAVVFVVSLVGLLQYSRSLRSSGIQAAAERARLTVAIDQKQKYAKHMTTGSRSSKAMCKTLKE